MLDIWEKLVTADPDTEIIVDGGSKCMFTRKHMASLLIAVIYLIFMSLGLPDSLMGSGWPVMYREFAVPSSYAGYVSMTICFMTIISSLVSPYIITLRDGRGSFARS